MFGTDWPVVDPVRAVHGVRDLRFSEDVLRKIMRENAVRVFKLDQLPAGG